MPVFSDVGQWVKSTFLPHFYSHCVFVYQLCLCVSSGAVAGPQLNNNQLYKFSYTTEVRLDKNRGSKEGGAGYRISSDVNVNLVWRDPSNKDDQLMRVVVCGPLCAKRTQNNVKISAELLWFVFPVYNMLTIRLLTFAAVKYSLFNRSQMSGLSMCLTERRRRMSFMDQQPKALWGKQNWQLWQNLSSCIWKMERWDHIPLRPVVLVVCRILDAKTKRT